MSVQVGSNLRMMRSHTEETSVDLSPQYFCPSRILSIQKPVAGLKVGYRGLCVGKVGFWASGF